MYKRNTDKTFKKSKLRNSKTGTALLSWMQKFWHIQLEDGE